MEIIIMLNILLRIVLFLLMHVIELNCFFVAILSASAIGSRFDYESVTVIFIGLGLFLLLLAIHVTKYGFWILSVLFTTFWTYIVVESCFKDYEGLIQKIIVSVMCFIFILFLHILSRVRIQGDSE